MAVSVPEENGTATDVNGTHESSLKTPLTAVDRDAQAEVIDSLRTQIQDLFSQVSQLNGKLVKSYDRVSDLEDELHVAETNMRASSAKISQLELERTQHLSALNTGLLVEKSNVTTELTRLMEKATEEAAQRGQAESARAAIEKDLDDLSASLFNQANTMVAEARYARSQSEKKVEEAETALKSAEDAVAAMQRQMQEMQAEREVNLKQLKDMRVLVGQGRSVEPPVDGNVVREAKLLSSHLPYQEFLLFVAHLRSLHHSSPSPPPMSTLLPLPFIARLQSEDSDPTVRLDLAPSLNWLSRRSVLTAIHNGNLTIEPMATSMLLYESTSSSSSGRPSGNALICALCGTLILSNADVSNITTSSFSSNQTTNTWSSNIFKRTLTYSGTSSPSATPPTSPKVRSKTHPSPQHRHAYPSQLFVFHVTSSTLTSSTGNPLLSSPSLSQSSSNTGYSNPPNHPSIPTTVTTSSANYVLCNNGWCLNRLRMTCTLWAFVRTGIIDRIWEEEVPNLPPPIAPVPTNVEKPPVPPRRRGLWGMATALGEKASSWAADGDKSRKEQTKKGTQPHRVLAPKLETPAPPPLPKRNEGRARRGTVSAAQFKKPVPPEPPSVAEDSDEFKTPPSDTTPTIPSVPTVPVPAEPVSVPLPDSRPPSRAAGSRPASPALVGAASASSAAPPPLPRRAAARAMRNQVQGDASSRPATPVVAPASRPQTPSPEAKPELSSVTAENPQNGDAVLTAAEQAREGVNVAAAVKDKDDHPLDAPAEVPSSQPELENASASVEVPETRAETQQEVTTLAEASNPETVPTEPDASETSKLDVDTLAPAAADLEGDIQASPIEAAETDATPPQDKESVFAEHSSSPRQEVVTDDQEVYIGETTWEERTWKELVRLKEDMFWARVGGVR